MKDKKTIFSVVVVSLIIIISAVLIGIAIKKTSIQIDLYEADVFIDSNGNMDVSETWIIDYPGGYNVRFRDIKYNKNHYNNPLLSGLDYQNDKSTFENSSVEVIVHDLDKNIDITNEIDVGYSFNGDRDELGQPVECVPESSTCESIFVNLINYGGMKGKKAFTYSYRINGAVTQYSDISELNWVFFDTAESKIKRAELNITLPSNSYSEDEILAWGHGTSNGYIKIESNNKINIVAKNISSSDKLEIRTAFPNSLVSGIDSSHKINGNLKEKIIDYETKLADETNKRIVAIKVVNVVTILSVFLTAFAIYKVYKKYDKEYEPEFKGEYLYEAPSDIKPAEMSYLYYFGKTQDEDVTATILDLVRRKVLILKDKGVEITSDDPDFDLVLADDYDKSSLDQHELVLINMFINVIGDGKKVNTQDIKNYGKKYGNAQKLMDMGARFAKTIKSEYKNKNYFENARQKAASKGGLMFLVYILLFFGFLIAAAIYNLVTILNIFVIIILAIVYGIYLLTIKRRTKYGNEEYAKWKAFKNFLENFSDFSDYPMPSIVIWEKYLVYATSFKIADKVMKQLKVKLPEISDAQGNDQLTFMSGYFYGRYNSFVFVDAIRNSYRDAKVNAMSTIAAHHASSGGGRGGGFSGGSSFGGGGGGGRSR